MHFIKHKLQNTKDICYTHVKYVYGAQTRINEFYVQMVYCSKHLHLISLSLAIAIYACGFNESLKMFPKHCINYFSLVVYIILLHWTVYLSARKYSNENMDTYSEFFNFGDKKIVKLNRSNLENAIIKSKVEVLGEVFKQNIDTFKTWSELDLVFLVDGSSSIGKSNFKSEVKFVKKIMSDVTVDYNHTRVAIITFSSAESVVCKGRSCSTNLLFR